MKVVFSSLQKGQASQGAASRIMLLGFYLPDSATQSSLINRHDVAVATVWSEVGAAIGGRRRKYSHLSNDVGSKGHVSQEAESRILPGTSLNGLGSKGRRLFIGTMLRSRQCGVKSAHGLATFKPCKAMERFYVACGDRLAVRVPRRSAISRTRSSDAENMLPRNDLAESILVI